MLKKYFPFCVLCLFLAACAGSGNPASVEEDIAHGLAGVGQATQQAADDVEAAFEGGYNTNGPLSPAEREHAREMARLCGMSESQIQTLRARGLGWPAIAESCGIASQSTGRAVWNEWQ